MTTGKRSLVPEDMLSISRLSEPEISPDGNWIAYVVSKPQVSENVFKSDIWLVSRDGKDRRRLTESPKKDSHPRFSPDGKSILFESTRSGKSQIWIVSVNGGEPVQLTDLANGANSAIWSRDGSRIAFVSQVWAEYSKLPFEQSNKKNLERLEDMEKNPVKVQVHDRLFYRHWDSYTNGQRLHLFVANVGTKDQKLSLSGITELTPWDVDCYPNAMTFSAGDEYTFSPDGKYLYFTSSPWKNEAWMTDYKIYRVPVTGGEAENVVPNMPAGCGLPRFSPDGKWLAFRAQKRICVESDFWRLYVQPAAGGEARLLTEWDQSVDCFTWHPSGTKLFLASEVSVNRQLFELEVASGKTRALTTNGTAESFSCSSSGDIAYSISRLSFPARLFLREDSGATRQVSNENEEGISKIHLPDVELVSVSGAGNDPMEMALLYPKNFDPKKKWPVAYLVHGGPESAWIDGWSYRWNSRVWAEAGYVVAMPNPRGSTGYGEAYKDGIHEDWGGKCFEDLMKGVDYLETLPFIDKDRMAAAGGSFGGYMMAWFEGHTDRFKTLINHCGIYNLESMYLTEELWFVEQQMGGVYWEKPELYEKWSPHKTAHKFNTPMLILHGERDYRVPVSEAHQLFTVLQRRGVPSRLVVFPEEGHWILKPGNYLRWMGEILKWLQEWVPPGPK